MHTPRIHLLERDLRDVQPNFLEDILAKGKIPKVPITLALSIFEDYERIFANLYNAMPPGTRFAMMEIYAERAPPSTTANSPWSPHPSCCFT